MNTWNERITLLTSAAKQIRSAQADLNVLTHTNLFESLALCDDQLCYCLRMCNTELAAQPAVDEYALHSQLYCIDTEATPKDSSRTLSGKSRASGERNDD